METIERKRKRIERRVEALRGFYVHCVVYCVVNSGLFCINYLFERERWWFYFPLFGWGVGLLMHGLSVCKSGLWGETWKERKIEELMKK